MQCLRQEIAKTYAAYPAGDRNEGYNQSFLKYANTNDVTYIWSSFITPKSWDNGLKYDVIG